MSIIKKMVMKHWQLVKSWYARERKLLIEQGRLSWFILWNEIVLARWSLVFCTTIRLVVMTGTVCATMYLGYVCYGVYTSQTERLFLSVLTLLLLSTLLVTELEKGHLPEETPL